eukprot:TRINITY_DN3537_c1_g1_i1.p1 TRINITY_DN3537_c1_g1~~TRINITY_DN3537_c1_g1_i1.p1  ORF type:complete len:248 (+),score=49.48 TRINITY_DN3537_c1_g1_i1:46-744(+)
MPAKDEDDKEKSKKLSLHRFAKSLVSTEDLKEMVKLPSGTQLNHWLSVHCVDFYNIANVVYGSITEFCTDKSCPVMNCGKRYEYLWRDKGEYKKATRVSSPVYVDLLMNWAENQINDETIFPTSAADPYPTDFVKTVSSILRRLFRVYAHIYHTHFLRVKQLGEEPHLNTSFKHIVLFCIEFDLIPASDMIPLSGLITSLLGKQFEKFFEDEKKAKKLAKEKDKDKPTTEKD